MESLIHLVHQAVAAFKQKDYEQTIILLDKAYEYVSALEYTAMDAKIFNALYDAYEMLALIAALGVFEKNAFLEKSLSCYHQALDAFTQEQGGTLAALKLASKNFEQLLRAMAVAVYYLRRKNWRMTDFPPPVSFEITSNGQIRLYAWQANQENQVANVAELKAEFEQLFKEQHRSEQFFLDQIAQLFEAKDYEAGLQLIDQAIAQHEALKPEGFLRKAQAYMQLENYEQAVDMLMKARVLGLPKHQIKALGQEACQALLKTANTIELRKKWSELLQNFF